MLEPHEDNRIYDPTKPHRMKFDDDEELLLEVDPRKYTLPAVEFFNDDGEFLMALDLHDIRAIHDHLTKIEQMKQRK